MQSTYKTVAQLVNFNNSNGTGKNKTEPIISVHKEQGTIIRLCIAKPYFSLLHFLAFSLGYGPDIHIRQTHHAPAQVFSHLLEIRLPFSLLWILADPSLTQLTSTALSGHKRCHSWPIAPVEIRFPSLIECFTSLQNVYQYFNYEFIHMTIDLSLNQNSQKGTGDFVCVQNIIISKSLTIKLKYLEQDRKPRDKPMQLWSTNLW